MSDVDAPAVPIATGPGVGEGGDGFDAPGPEQREHTCQEPGLAQRLDIVKQRKPVENYRLGRLEVGKERAEGVRHAWADVALPRPYRWYSDVIEVPILNEYTWRGASQHEEAFRKVAQADLTKIAQEF